MDNKYNIAEIAKSLWDNEKVNKKQFGTVSNVIYCLRIAESLGAKNKGDLLLYLQNMNVRVYKGEIKVELNSHLNLALAQGSGVFGDIEEFFIDKDGKRLSAENNNLDAQIEACIVRLKRKGGVWNEYAITANDLVCSGGKRHESGSWLFPNGSTPWKQYPKQMWRHRTRNMALKALFADCLKNLDSDVEEVEVTESQPETKPDVQEKANETKAKKALEEVFPADDLKVTHDPGNLEAKLEPPKMEE